MIGMRACRLWDRTRAMNSKPSIPGICRSVTMAHMPFGSFSRSAQARSALCVVMTFRAGIELKMISRMDAHVSASSTINTDGCIRIVARLSGDEAIANPVHRQKVAWQIWVGFQLLPQANHVGIHGACVGKGFAASHRIYTHTPRDAAIA